MDPSIIPLAGISVGIIVPLAVFFWLYHKAKHKNEDEIVRKNIKIGDYVVFERAGDVIPHII